MKLDVRDGSRSGLMPDCWRISDQNHLQKTRSFHNSIRRKNLLEGYSVRCGLRSDGHGRVTIRGQLFLLIPKHADFESEWIQCELLEGPQHPHTCATNGLEEDPARRLGIRFKFKSRDNHDIEESWEVWKTESDIKRLNSLADFLEDRSDESTARQSRRYSSEKKGKRNNRPILYT